MWRKVFEQVAFALIAFQMIMVGLLLIKGALWQPLALLPLPFMSLFTWISYRTLFNRSQRVLSLRAATDLDRRDQVGSWMGSKCFAPA